MSGIHAALLGSGSPFPNALDIQYVDGGSIGPAGSRALGYITGAIGSISDGTSNIYGGAAITELWYDQDSNSTSLKITGTLSNSGWTSIFNVSRNITLNRSAATFSTASGSSTWIWASGAGFMGTGNQTIVFT